MSRSVSPIVLAACAWLTACESPAPSEPVDVQLAHVRGLSQASGGGQWLFSGVFPGKFSFTAQQISADGTARGQLRSSLDVGGTLAEFHGEVTCLTVDLAEGRAWVGGVVTRNDSELEPFASEERFQPGQDIWFRVLDSGEGQSEPDRTTFTGFSGDAGFATSLDYCAGMPWPDDNERTHPVTAGNIQVK
jgi:hypothetical protein